MIGYDRLGTNGRFGNQLFQFAGLRGIAAHHGYDWCIPPDSHQTFANYGMHHCFKKKFPTGFVNEDVSPRAMSSFQHISHFNPGTKNVTESGFNFDEHMFNNFEDGSNLDGYLQTEKYFKHIESEIREDFKFKKEIFDECKGIFDSVLNDKEKAVSLHIRRGDYTKNPNHPIQSLDWYREAISIFDSDCEIVIFSDDSAIIVPVPPTPADSPTRLLATISLINGSVLVTSLSPILLPFTLVF